MYADLTKPYLQAMHPTHSPLANCELTLPDALALFAEQLRADGRSKHTLDQYRRHVQAFSEWAGSIGLIDCISEIDHVVLAKYLCSDAVQKRADGSDKKVATVNAVRSSLKGFFGYLADADYLPKSPARLIRRARCGTAPPRGLTREERTALMNTLAQAQGEQALRDHALFRLLLETGIRMGSAVALDVGDFDCVGGWFEVRVAKGNYPQRHRLREGIREHMREYLEDREAGPAFLGVRGERLTTRHVGRLFSEWTRATGIKRRVSVHELRHTFAIEMYQRTRDIFAVQQALGHRSILSTVRYAASAEAAPYNADMR